MTNFRESLVKKVIRQEANWVIGGYENGIADGKLSEMPSKEALTKEVYTAVMNSDVVEVGGGLIPVRKDIRFLGKERLQFLVAEIIEKTK
jgi:hypothetical protein